MKWLLATVFALTVALFPTLAFAEDGEDDNFLMRINADVHIPAGETVDTVFVIDGNAVVDGTVTGSLFVISGNATVNGSVADALVVIKGNIDLSSTAQVNDVVSVRGELIRAEGATVAGSIEQRDNFDLVGLQAAGIIFSIYFWVALTIAVVAAALIFAAIGGRQLTGAARAMTGEAVNTIVGVVFVWVAIPILAVLVILTIVGIPLGIAILLFLLPALGFLGYIVAGTRLGTAIVNRGGGAAPEHPYLAAALGVLILQLVVLIPILGGFIAFIAAIWGAGALAYIGYRAAGGKSLDSTTTTTTTAPNGGAQPQPSA